MIAWMAVKRTRRQFLKAIPAAALAASGQSSSALTLWYKRPASKWTEALPLGTGRLGAMVFGGVEIERLQLNEDTLWSGSPKDWNNPEAKEHLKEVRRLVLEQKDFVAAGELCKKMQGPYNQSYLPLGNLYLKFEGISGSEDYKRELDLDEAIARVTFKSGAIRYTREVLASAPDQVIAIRLTADKPASISFEATLDSLLQFTVSGEGNGGLVMRGKVPSHVDPNYVRTNPSPVQYSDEEGRGMRFEARILVKAEGGSMSATAASVRVVGANAATVLLTAGTGFRGFARMPDRPADAISRTCVKTLAAAAKEPFSTLRREHVQDHRALFRRVSLNLGRTPAADRPTDERILNSGATPDPQLIELYFQYGRYLLIASSRPGSQPANLQGIWNDAVRPPWSSNYTVNINTQMNYWPAESTNLSECHGPLFDLIGEASQTGRKTVEVNYGLRGWTTHHNVDLWRQSAPVGDGKGNPVWANWPLGGPWLCQHLWEHYAFTGDQNFLRERAYPLMKGAAEFALDWLVADARGRLVTCPSVSPENTFIDAAGNSAVVSAGCSMDMEIIWDLLTNCIAASEILDIDSDFRTNLAATKSRLLPLQIGRHGQLQEWAEDFEEKEPGHRHVSHLFGLHPGRQITMRTTPERAKAARVSLERRLANGGGHTGWSRAWLINFWARLGDGAKAHENISALLKKSTSTNLLDMHPPFQIDGNFGGTAAIAEMLLQSHAGEVALLPALPPDWIEGSVKGLRARGGLEVDIHWRGGRVVRVKLHAIAAGSHIIRVGGRSEHVKLSKGQQRELRFSRPCSRLAAKT